MTELEEKYLVHEQPIYPLQTTPGFPLQATHQSLVPIPSENAYIQSLTPIQASPSTSVYSESTSSPFSQYNFDDSTI